MVISGNLSSEHKHMSGKYLLCAPKHAIFSTALDLDTSKARQQSSRKFNRLIMHHSRLQKQRPMKLNQRRLPNQGQGEGKD